VFDLASKHHTLVFGHCSLPPRLSFTTPQFFTGTLPTTLGNLKNLMEIHVPNNALNGTLPSELGRLTALKDVGLQSNVFTGTIPRELGNLGNIW